MSTWVTYLANFILAFTRSAAITQDIELLCATQDKALHSQW